MTTTPPRLRRALLVAASLAILAAARPARAQSANEKAAEKAYDEGMKLLDRGKIAEACPKLEESQRLDPAMGTQFRLAECWEKLGRTASAWSLFRDVMSQAQAAGRDDRAALSSARAAALEPRLTRLLIVVAPSAKTPGLIVRRDGAVVDETQWGRGVAVDPGPHVISASAPGKRPWEQSQSARSGTVEVTVPGLDPVDAAASSGAPSGPVVATPEEPSGPHRSLTPGLVLGGAAFVGIASGIALVVVANGKKGTASTTRARLAGVDCNVPSPDCTSLADSAKAAGTLSNAAFWTLLGSGLAAAGTAAYFLWPADKAPAPSGAVIHVLPSVGVGGPGLFATGKF
jgi:hypothetical protein